MLPFHTPVQDDFAAVNELIVAELHSDVDLVENIGHYLVEAGGKRLRPLLVLLTANALECNDPKKLKLAAVIEFIHTATLLHDDVVDVSAMRRGRPTANAKWGNAPSVLVGDFLYSRAFQLMVSIGSMGIMNILADTTNTISEGEVQQLINAKNPDVDEAAYMDVIHKKTAILFAAASETAAVLAGADAACQDELRQYGHHVGMAFQIMDDVLDYGGEAAQLGKNVGDDLAEGKPTLPLIIAMQRAPQNEAQVIAEAIRNGSVATIAKVVAIVKKHQGLDYATACARQHVDRAIACLGGLPDTRFKQAMHEVAEFAVNRQY